MMVLNDNSDISNSAYISYVIVYIENTFDRIPEIQRRMRHYTAVHSTIPLNCLWFRIFYPPFQVKEY